MKEKTPEDKPKSESEPEPEQESVKVSNDFIADLPEDFAPELEIPLEDLQIPEAPPPGVENLKPKLPSFLELTRTKLDVDAVRTVANKVSAQVDELLQTKQLRQAFRKSPGEYKPLKKVSNYRDAAPCGIIWDEMTGDDKLRFCQRCRKRVYDFTEMDDAEGQAVVQKMEEQSGKNATLYKRSDGKFLSGDCPVGRQKKILIVVPAVLGCLSFIAVLTLAVMQPPVIKSTEAVQSNSAAAESQTSAKTPIYKQAALNPKTKQIGTFKHDPELVKLAMSSRNKHAFAVTRHDPQLLAKIAASRAIKVKGCFKHEHLGKLAPAPKALTQDLNSGP